MRRTHQSSSNSTISLRTARMRRTHQSSSNSTISLRTARMRRSGRSALSPFEVRHPASLLIVEGLMNLSYSPRRGFNKTPPTHQSSSNAVCDNLFEFRPSLPFRNSQNNKTTKKRVLPVYIYFIRPNDFRVTSVFTAPTWYTSPEESSLMITSAGEKSEVSIL
jgi:hypothetical protein